MATCITSMDRFCWLNSGRLVHKTDVTHLHHFFSVQRISTLEAELAGARDELQGVRAHHKRQLSEMTLHREEERQKAHRDKEESVKRLRSDMEAERRGLERSHQQEKAAAQEKVGKKGVFKHKTPE